MLLTALGCYGPYPPAGGACSGYLLRAGGYNLLIDCGNGVLSRLQHFLPCTDLDAIILSHLHADHVSDTQIMRYALEGAFKKGSLDRPLTLYAPAEPLSEYERLPYKNAYRVETLREGEAVILGPFKIFPAAVVHAVPAMALKIEGPGGILVYSGDTEHCKALVDIAAGADLFLCEANYGQEDVGTGLPNHLSAAQAATTGADAGVSRLLLTHHHPAADLEAALAEAEKIFPGAEMALEGKTYPVISRAT